MALNTVIIDDSFFVRETLSKMIVEAGHLVSKKFDSGESIINELDNINPDVLFLDIILPDKSGLDVLPIIRDRFPNAKVVMLSSMTQGNTIAAALRLGATDFVSKPIGKEQLLDILEKFSTDIALPSVEELSTIGVGTILVTTFLSELGAHASSTLREIILNQARSLLVNVESKYSDMFIIDLEKISISPNPELWGKYSESEVIERLAEIPQDLSMEISFLYPEDFINNIYEQSILTMASRVRINKLFELVPPDLVGLPDLPNLEDQDAKIHSAGKTFDELESNIAISVYLSGMMGSTIISNITAELMDEHDIMRNAIFYSSLTNSDYDNFQEGLFGPLPVSSTGDIPLSALVYTFKIRTVEDAMPNMIMLTFYFTQVAEKIVSDYNRLSFIIKTRISTIVYAEEMDRLFLRKLQEDAIKFILE